MPFAYVEHYRLSISPVIHDNDIFLIHFKLKHKYCLATTPCDRYFAILVGNYIFV